MCSSGRTRRQRGDGSARRRVKADVGARGLQSPPMPRVLVTGGAGTIGGAVVRRLMTDPEWEGRVAGLTEAPQWMREACEVATGDLRDADFAHEAMTGCSHVIHLAAIVGGIANFHKLP